MELFTRILLAIHVIAGFTSIFIFWLPMLTKKGGRIHKLSGKLYVYAMWVVTLSAMMLCVKNVVIEKYNSALFLGFLSFITAGPLWYGITILKHRNGPSIRLKKIQLALNIVILGMAVFMILYNTFVLDGRHILMYIFGGLGLTALPAIIRYSKGKTNGRNHIQEHAIGMVTTAIAGYTAFFAFGGRNFFGEIFTGNLMIIPWVLPGVLGTIANIYCGRKYASKV